MRSEPERGKAAPIHLPDFWLTRYQRLFRFNHDELTIEEFGRYHAEKPAAVTAAAPVHASVEIEHVVSNMDRARYERAVHDTVRAIEAGDFY
ncbi:MAG: hypothetical protein DI596_15690, partial [Azospira oryzae]